MAEKITGIFPVLMILPGETIEDVLDDRDMTQEELAARTGFTKAYINSVIRGEKPISAKLAKRLEYVFDVPMSFWRNLQENYDAEHQEHGCGVRKEGMMAIRCCRNCGKSCVPASKTSSGKSGKYGKR